MKLHEIVMWGIFLGGLALALTYTTRRYIRPLIKPLPKEKIIEYARKGIIF